MLSHKLKPIHPLFTFMLCCITLLLAASTDAVASKNQESIVMDDRLLLDSGDTVRNQTLDHLQALGVDTVHALVRWNNFAPDQTSTTKPDGFDGSDPTSYSSTAWDPYDELVKQLDARGMSLILVPTGTSPRWASDCKGSDKKKRSCKPNPTEYMDFVSALGTRYSGSYSDDNQGGSTLPRVSRWSIWNEPGQQAWLYPQFVKSKGNIIPTSPITYRKLVYAGASGLAATGHSSDQIILGEFSPIGRRESSNSKSKLAKQAMSPALFIRELFCLDSNGKPYKGSAAKQRSCNGKYTKLPVNAVAIHPYSSGAAFPPLTKAPSSDDIVLSNIKNLNKLMKLGKKRKRIATVLPTLSTEYGVQTDPPDYLIGQDPEKVAEYINQADYISYKNPSVASVSQYELADEPNLAGFQTGLFFNDMTAKPSYEAYRVPIYVVKSGSNVKVYGQLRPAAAGSTETVEIQRKASSSGEFETVETLTLSNLRHNFLTKVTGQKGSWRLKWQPSTGGDTLYSRTAKARKR